VTFLFTDIDGSTRRWETDAEATSLAMDFPDAVLFAREQIITARHELNASKPQS
jgi:hypothetical protein